MLRSALSLLGDAKKMEVPNKFQAKFPNNWRGFNNAGVLALWTGDMASAESSLNRANELSPKWCGISNMGVVAKNKGNIKKAEELSSKQKLKVLM